MRLGIFLRDEFLNDKSVHISSYSVKEFKKTFLGAAIYLESMIKEGRTLGGIYRDVKDMKEDSKTSRLGNQIEFILQLLNNPKNINDRIMHRLKIWRQGYLTRFFIGNISVYESLSKCSIGSSFKGESSNDVCLEDNCDIKSLLKTCHTEIAKIIISIKNTKDKSLIDLYSVLTDCAKNPNNFDSNNCGKIGDFIIVIDYKDFLNTCKNSVFCSTDHHFEELCPPLGVDYTDPLKKKNIVNPT